LKHDLYYGQDYNVLATIITDGQENSSTEFTHKETKLLIANISEKPNWAFGFIGANIDVEAVAGSLSISQKCRMKFDANDNSVKQMFGQYTVKLRKIYLT
jgi:hypothetical protein